MEHPCLPMGQVNPGEKWNSTDQGPKTVAD